MTVGERLKARRKELGLSAEKVAEKLGLSPSTIYRYENGEINQMGIDKLAPIAAAVNTTPAYLMGWEDDIGEEAKKSPSDTGEGEVTDRQVKAAFFHGTDMTEAEMDAAWDDVMDLRELVLKRREREKGGK